MNHYAKYLTEKDMEDLHLAGTKALRSMNRRYQFYLFKKKVLSWFKP